MDFIFNTAEESEEGEEAKCQRARGGDEEEVTPRGQAKLVESGGYGGSSERVSTHVLCA